MTGTGFKSFFQIRKLSILIRFFILSFVTLSCLRRNEVLKIGDYDVLALGPQDSCNFSFASNLRISWKSSTPVNFDIHESVPKEWDDVILRAANRWNDSFGGNLIRISRGAQVNPAPAYDDTNVIYWITNWPKDENTKQARTITHRQRTKLRDADIVINGKYFKYYTSDEDYRYGYYHLESILVHEFGHALGLVHFGESKNVMYPTLGEGEIRTKLGAEEIDSLRCEY